MRRCTRVRNKKVVGPSKRCVHWPSLCLCTHRPTGWLTSHPATEPLPSPTSRHRLEASHDRAYTAGLSSAEAEDDEDVAAGNEEEMGLPPLVPPLPPLPLLAPVPLGARAMMLPVGRSHSVRRPSSSPLAAKRPQGAAATDVTGALCPPSSSRTASPVLTSWMRTAPSDAPDIRNMPLGCHPSEVTSDTWPAQVTAGPAVNAELHTRAVPSRPAEANTAEERGLNATAHTGRPPCPLPPPPYVARGCSVSDASDSRSAAEADESPAAALLLLLLLLPLLFIILLI